MKSHKPYFLLRADAQVRASIQVLEREAVRVGYKLAFASAIDPGIAWWEANPREWALEDSDFSREGALAELRAMFAGGEVPYEEVRIFDEENIELWSRRVAALRRVAAGIRRRNPYPNSAPFTGKPHLRHKFESY